MTRYEAIKILEYPVKKWSMEWDEREDGLSYYEALDMAISALRQQEHFRDLTKKVDPLTNAQKIRSMSDEELAEFLWDFNRADVSTVKMGKFGPHMFRYRLKEWLQQPAEEDDHDERKENENV